MKHIIILKRLNESFEIREIFSNSAKITPCLTKIIYNCLKNKIINENDKKKHCIESSHIIDSIIMEQKKKQTKFFDVHKKLYT
jgi:hypothetical protein